jgi:putative component of membrane protein insertase Oxa1/YidC/SpoIIIJ protein YidD
MTKNHCLTFALIVSLAAIASFSNLQAEDRMKGPITKSGTLTPTPYYQTSTVKFIWKSAIQLYSSTLSPADGPRSPSYPTSTAYGKQAIQKYGFFTGVILTADRLIHESDVHQGPKIVLYGHRRYFDPIESNTYWWD